MRKWLHQLAAECPPEDYSALLRRIEMPKTDAQRRAAADARKRDQGLTRVSVWVPVESAAEIKREAQRLVAENRKHTCDDENGGKK